MIDTGEFKRQVTAYTPNSFQELMASVVTLIVLLFTMTLVLQMREIPEFLIAMFSASVFYWLPTGKK